MNSRCRTISSLIIYSVRNLSLWVWPFEHEEAGVKIVKIAIMVVHWILLLLDQQKTQIDITAENQGTHFHWSSFPSGLYSLFDAYVAYPACPSECDSGGDTQFSLDGRARPERKTEYGVVLGIPCFIGKQVWMMIVLLFSHWKEIIFAVSKDIIILSGSYLIWVLIWNFCFPNT